MENIQCQHCGNSYPQTQLQEHLLTMHPQDQQPAPQNEQVSNAGSIEESIQSDVSQPISPENSKEEQKKQEEHPNLNAGDGGNKWAEKWKTPEERIVACERYCEYLRLGRSKMFYPEADENTIKRYIENYPREFRAEKVADAERKGLSVIENRIHAASVGKIPGANATLLIFLAKNKLNWKDKQDITSDDRPIEPGWRKPEEDE